MRSYYKISQVLLQIFFLLILTTTFVIIPKHIYADGDYVGCSDCQCCYFLCQEGPVCDPDPSCGGGGGIPPDSSSPSASLKQTAPQAICGMYNTQTQTTPVLWYWLYHTKAQLQVYDSTGAWWFNDWIESNSYAIFSRDNRGVLPGIPPDGRSVFARISTNGKTFSSTGQVSCEVR